MFRQAFLVNHLQETSFTRQHWSKWNLQDAECIDQRHLRSRRAIKVLTSGVSPDFWSLTPAREHFPLNASQCKSLKHALVIDKMEQP
jgi:hypothetical protein